MPGNALDVTFPAGYDLGPCFRAEFREGTNQHPIAILDVTAPKSSINIPVERTPVFVDWGSFPTRNRTFYGYVNHHESSSVWDSKMRIYCVGASLPLNTVNPHTWINVTGSYIAGQVAARYGLRAIVTKSPLILPVWTQGNETDLQMLTRLANKIGYVFWVDEATLYFLDPTQLITRAAQRSVYSFTNNGAASDTLGSLNIISLSMAPGNGALSNMRTFGIDKTSGQVIQGSSVRSQTDLGMSLPALDSINSDSADSAWEAQWLSESANKIGNWVTAKAQVKQNSGVRVGDAVYLDGNDLNDQYEGYWLVRGVNSVSIAVPSNVDLSTQLILTRNQDDRNVFRSNLPIAKSPATSEVRLSTSYRWESGILGTTYV